MSTPPLATLKELQDGTYTLLDVADMHEALDIQEDIMARVEEENRGNRR